MKILIKEYNNPDSSQCDYLSERLNRMDGVQCGIWNASGGLYSVMDNFKPNAYVIHLSQLNNELFTYIKDEETDTINKLFIVANQCKHQDILSADKALRGIGYDNHTYITNNIKHLDKAPENTVYMSEAADVAAVDAESLKYKINTLIILDKIEELGKVPDGTYHIMSTNPEMKGRVDICIPLIRFSAMLKNYKNVSIRTNDHVLRQFYYDAVLSGCNVTIDSSNSHCKDRMKELEASMRKDGYSVRDTILHKHLSQHRAEQLLSLIPTESSERYFTV